VLSLTQPLLASRSAEGGLESTTSTAGTAPVDFSSPLHPAAEVALSSAADAGQDGEHVRAPLRVRTPEMEPLPAFGVFADLQRQLDE